MHMKLGLPGSPGVKNLPSKAGDAGSIPGWGTKIPPAEGQLSPQASTKIRCSQNNKRKKFLIKKHIKSWCIVSGLTLMNNLKLGKKENRRPFLLGVPPAFLEKAPALWLVCSGLIGEFTQPWLHVLLMWEPLKKHSGLGCTPRPLTSERHWPPNSEHQDIQELPGLI